MNKLLKNSLLVAIVATIVLPLSAQQVPAGSKTARYKIHRTEATKSVIVDGGVTCLERFKEGLACVGHKKGYFVINLQGEKVFDIPSGYVPKGTQENLDGSFNVGYDSGRLMVYSSSAKQAIIYDTKGQVVKQFKDVQNASGFQDGVALLKKYEKQPGKFLSETVWYHIDVNGNTLSTKVPSSGYSTTHFRVFPLRDGLSPVYDERVGRWGYRNAKCEIVIPIKYGGFGAPDGGGFFQGLSRANDKEAGKWGYLDTKGNWVIQPMYTERPGNFTGPYAKVVDKAGKQYMINTKGEIVYTEPNPGRGDRLADFQANGHSVWLLDRNAYIIDSNFQKVAQCFLNSLGYCVDSGDDWFLWWCHGCGDGYKMYDLQGNLLLEWGERSVFNEGIIGQRNYYFNDKGEIIVIFEDTQF